jgi:allantoicase
MAPQLTDTNAPKFAELNNLCSGENGARILFATDDWFAAAENLLEVKTLESIKVYLYIINYYMLPLDLIFNLN